MAQNVWGLLSEDHEWDNILWVESKRREKVASDLSQFVLVSFPSHSALKELRTQSQAYQPSTSSEKNSISVYSVC